MTRLDTDAVDRPLGRRIDFFAALDDSARRGVEARCRWFKAAAQETIVDFQSPSHEVYFVIAGAVRVVNQSRGGQEISFQDMGPGAFFGEIAAIDGAPRSASVIALGDSLLAGLDSRAFVDVVTRHPDLAHAVMTRLAAMVRRSNQRVMELGTLAAHNRVFAELLRLARPTEEPNVAAIEPIPAHGAIAGRVITSRETVARALGNLSRRGLARREHGRLVIRDLRRLTRLVEDFEPH